MTELELDDAAGLELSPERVREQLALLIRDPAFRSSKRSVAFLRYVVEQTLSGLADQIKERTIGVEVFDRDPAYDTNTDHVVRTAATELRKRLAIYYGEERNRLQLRIGLIPGSYIPRFSLPAQAHVETEGLAEPETAAPAAEAAAVIPAVATLPEAKPVARTGRRWMPAVAACMALALAGALAFAWMHRETAQDVFWRPVLDTAGPVLLAVGDVPKGPPTLPVGGGDGDSTSLILGTPDAPTVPFADAVTIARVVGSLEASGKRVLIRRESVSSFSDLREGPVVLIGAFNNEWTMRLTHQLRYSLALDAERHLIYIKDARNPAMRSWSWATNKSVDEVKGSGGAAVHDYALISRIRNSETGHVVVVIGGLYTYGTQAAGEFLTDPQMLEAIAKAARPDAAHPNLQIVLETTVTDETPGPPRILAVSAE